MTENTSPHSDPSSRSDPWAEATDSVAAHARADEEAARADEAAARADEEAARADEAAGRADEQAARADEHRAREESVRRILADVAAGRISPEDAAAKLEQARAGAPTPSAADTETSGARTATETSPATATTSRLRVRAVGRRVRIIGEPFVSTVAVDGPHVVRQEGNTLVVTSEGEFGASLDGFTLMRSRSLRDVQERVFDLGRELSVRVNPNLIVEVEVTAGSVTAERLPGLEQVRVTAGSARVRDVEGPIDVLVQAGSAQVEGKIIKGRSRLRAESGSMQLRLLPGSSVRIRPDVQLGRVQWEPPGKDREEHIVGDGDGILSLEVVMGTATVKEAP
ncbi:hypothetical protein [Actinopolymorpha alba]|uniref:hypothetical protein n=1 Tax=Actinopolymorpha alba TaxID=533267 RepID=UPI00037ED307|nr:hypothetical protein [Actinopolymorpha alba]